tara:strand:- start:2218 stop:2403 length:186 start_codon:yes stop_codon:yes gene_type:complete
MAFAGTVSFFVDDDNLESKTKAEISALTSTATHGDTYIVSDHNNIWIHFIGGGWFPEGIVE